MHDKMSEEYIVSNRAAHLPGGRIHYEKVVLKDNGYFLFEGDFELEIDELINLKTKSLNKYDFLAATPAGKKGGNGENGGDAPTPNAHVKIVIHNLKNSIHVKGIGGKGGDGGKGLDGGKGGDGGDGELGGKGGDGGDAGKGGDGGKGGNGPSIEVIYAAASEDVQVIVLTKEDEISEAPETSGGKGGNGGAAGVPGAGGIGGLSISNGNRAKAGQNGAPADGGESGDSGENGEVVITRKNHSAGNNTEEVMEDVT